MPAATQSQFARADESHDLTDSTRPVRTMADLKKKGCTDENTTPTTSGHFPPSACLGRAFCHDHGHD